MLLIVIVIVIVIVTVALSVHFQFFNDFGLRITGYDQWLVQRITSRAFVNVNVLNMSSLRVLSCNQSQVAVLQCIFGCDQVNGEFKRGVERLHLLIPLLLVQPVQLQCVYLRT